MQSTGCVCGSSTGVIISSSSHLILSLLRTETLPAGAQPGAALSRHLRKGCCLGSEGLGVRLGVYWGLELRDKTIRWRRLRRPAACGPLPFAQISPVWRLPSVKVTPPKPGNFGFKNHFDLIFHREHGRLSEFNLPLSLNALGVAHLLTYLTKLYKASA